eukprot:TRINITY_DN3500_c0_g1_i1.p1 TRINITY_DN3500_c0_g1~~TRINITY_DN3500_c0_g1_i1.p1  ORF type:complete len:482 (+),score=89.05 TRINITY_DN3500_c0_g1_i1:95-1447(+)
MHVTKRDEKPPSKPDAPHTSSNGSASHIQRRATRVGGSSIRHIGEKIVRKGHLSGHTSAIFTLNIVGDLCVSGSDDSALRIWDLVRLECKHVLEGHTANVTSCAISGSYVISGSNDNTIRVWNIHTGACESILQGHTHAVINLRAIENQIVSGSYDKTIRIWDLEKKECLFVLEGHAGEIESLQVEGVGANAKIFSGSPDGTIKIWSLESGVCLKTLVGHNGPVWSLQVLKPPRSENGDEPGTNSTQLLSGGGDFCLRVWDYSTGKCQRLMRGHTESIMSMKVINPSVFAGAHPLLYQPSHTQFLAKRRATDLPAARPADSPVCSASFVVTASDDCTLRMWDPTRGKCVTVFSGHQSEVEAIAVVSIDRKPSSAPTTPKESPAEDSATVQRMLVSGGFDGSLRGWDISSGKCTHLLLRAHSSDIACLTTWNDLLVSGGDDGKISLGKFNP